MGTHSQPNGREIILPAVSKFLSTTKTSGVSVSFGFPLDSFKREPEETPDLAPHNLQPSLSLSIFILRVVFNITSWANLK